MKAFLCSAQWAAHTWTHFVWPACQPSLRSFERQTMARRTSMEERKVHGKCQWARKCGVGGALSGAHIIPIFLSETIHIICLHICFECQVDLKWARSERSAEYDGSESWMINRRTNKRQWYSWIPFPLQPSGRSLCVVLQIICLFSSHARIDKYFSIISLVRSTFVYRKLFNVFQFECSVFSILNARSVRSGGAGRTTIYTNAAGALVAPAKELIFVRADSGILILKNTFERSAQRVFFRRWNLRSKFISINDSRRQRRKRMTSISKSAANQWEEVQNYYYSWYALTAARNSSNGSYIFFCIYSMPDRCLVCVHSLSASANGLNRKCTTLSDSASWKWHAVVRVCAIYVLPLPRYRASDGCALKTNIKQ